MTDTQKQIKKPKKINFGFGLVLMAIWTMILTLLPVGLYRTQAEEPLLGKKYTTDWEIPPNTEVKNWKSIIQIGATFENLEEDENGNAVVHGSIIYRAVTSPGGQAWLYFRLDPKLAPYLPDDFPAKMKGGFQRYVQRVKEDMVGTAASRF